MLNSREFNTQFHITETEMVQALFRQVEHLKQVEAHTQFLGALTLLLESATHLMVGTQLPREVEERHMQLAPPIQQLQIFRYSLNGVQKPTRLLMH